MSIDVEVQVHALQLLHVKVCYRTLHILGQRMAHTVWHTIKEHMLFIPYMVIICISNIGIPQRHWKKIKGGGGIKWHTQSARRKILINIHDYLCPKTVIYVRAQMQSSDGRNLYTDFMS